LQAPPPSSRWKLAASPAHSLSTPPRRLRRGPGRMSGWLPEVFPGSREKPLMMGAAWSIKNYQFSSSCPESGLVPGVAEHLEKLLQGEEVFFKKLSYGHGCYCPFPSHLSSYPSHPSPPWGGVHCHLPPLPTRQRNIPLSSPIFFPQKEVGKRERFVKHQGEGGSGTTGRREMGPNWNGFASRENKPKAEGSASGCDPVQRARR